jgi:SH3-like domain-containing protein
MLPYRLRRRLPLAVLGAAAVGATILLLVPSGEPVTRTAEVTTGSETEAVQPSYIAELPRPTTEDMVTGSISPPAEPTGDRDSSAIATSGLAPLAAVPPPPLDAATAQQVDAAAAAAEVEPPPGETVHVGASAVNVRAGPNTSSRKLFVLQPGDSVTATEVAGGWVRIVRSDGEGGWVYSRYLNGVPAISGDEAARPGVQAAEAMPKDGEVRQVSRRSVRLSNSVTVRDAPSTSATRLFTLRRGERIVMAEIEDGWARVVLPGGASGWIQVR